MNRTESAIYWSKLGRWWRKGGGKCIGVDNSGDRMYTMSNGETFILLAVCGIMAAGSIAVVCCGIWRLLR